MTVIAYRIAIGQNLKLNHYPFSHSRGIWHGARPREHGLLQSLFAALVCIPIDQEISRQAGEYLRRYHTSHRLELVDALIASTARIHSAALWTRNRKHYPMAEIEFW